MVVPFDPRILEQRLSDALALLRRQAATSVEGVSASQRVLDDLRSALERLLHVKLADVSWRESKELVLRAGQADCVLGQSQLELHGLDQAPDVEECSPYRIERFPGVAHPSTVVISRADAPNEMSRLKIARTTHIDIPTDLWDNWFVNASSVLGDIYTTIASIIRPALVAERQITVERIIGNTLLALHERLAQVAGSVEVADLDLVREAAAWVVQEVLAAEWSPPCESRAIGAASDSRSARSSPTSPQRAAEAGDATWHTDLRDIRDALRRAAGLNTLLDSAIEARLLERCLTTVLEPQAALGPPEKPAPTMLATALPFWLRAEALYRCLPSTFLGGATQDARSGGQGPPASKAEAEARTACETAMNETRTAIREYLARVKSPDMHDQDAASSAVPESARTWLTLVLLFELWDHANKIDGDSRLRLLFPRWRAALVYVMREVARYDWLGRRAHFAFRPRAYAEALRTLVELHAAAVVGVPLEAELRHLLDELSRDGHAPLALPAAAHLQHVLEVYIAGHVFMTCRFESGAASKTGKGERQSRDGEPWTVIERLVAVGDVRPSEGRVSEVKIAYSLAALAHDVGYLLYPYDGALHTALERADPDLHRVFELVRHSGHTAGREVATLAVQGLTSGEAACATPATDPDLWNWLKQARESAVPDHGLLGAFYVQRVCSRVAADVRRQAVRAVLLHSAGGGPIDSARDPVAALLYLCNEVFDWDTARGYAASRDALSRSFHVLAANAPAQEPRVASVRVEGVAFRFDGARLVGTFAAPTPAPGGSPPAYWPVVVVRLQPPERLDTPAYALWLAKAWRFSRLKARDDSSPTPLFQPAMVVRGRLRPELEHAGVDTRVLIETVAPRIDAPLRAALLAWLAESAEIGQVQAALRTHAWDADAHEWVFIAAANTLCEDPRPALARLDTLIDAALHGHAAGVAR